MICPPCKAAGGLNAIGQFSSAAVLHKQCESLNCPCQHRWGNWRNERRDG